MTPVKGDRLFGYKTDLFYICTSKSNANFPPVIIIRTSAWVGKEKKEAKILDVKKKKKKISSQVTLNRKPGKLYSEKTESFLFIFLLS